MCSMLLFIFAQKYLLLKREPLKSRPYKGPTLHAGVCVCLKKEIIICVIKFIWYGLIGWLTGNVAKICYFIKCIFKLLLQWINLMQLKGRENGTERVPHVELILPSRDPHDCSQFNLLWLFCKQTFDALFSVKSGGREDSQSETEKPW